MLVCQQNLTKEQTAMTLEEIKEKLKDRRLSMVALATGLSRQAIHNVVTGKTPNPSHETVRRLMEYLEGR